MHSEFEIVPRTVFRHQKGHRTIWIVCLLFCLLVGVGSAYGTWIGEPHDQRVYGVVFSSLLWSTMAGLSVLPLLACWRETLTVENGKAIQQGVIGRREIDLRDVCDARWRPASNGRITLRSLKEELTIHLEDFEPNERLWLIRYCRNALPDSVQQEWDLFCYRIAIPLRKHDSKGSRSPGPGEVKLTRRRWDWFLLPLVAFTAVYGVVACWKLQQPRMLIAPLPAVMLWLILRFSTPKQGIVSERISSQPEQKRFLIFVVWWLGVLIVGLVVFKLVNLPMPHSVVLGTIATVFFLGGLVWQARRCDRERQKRDREAAKVATQQWDDGERNLGKLKTIEGGEATLFGPGK